MADPKAPDLPDDCVFLVVQRPDEEQPSTYAVTIAHLRLALAAHGLHICSEAERKVLEKSGAVHQRWLESYVNIIVPTQADPQAFAWAKAELARRSGT